MSESLRAYVEKRSIPIPFVGCWLWLLSCGSHGYGQCTGDGARVTVAHRLSYLAFKGSIPNGMLVQHSCDNRWCVNPDHLSLGTDATNAWDKQLKGRAAKKFQAADVLRIKERLNQGATQRAVAAEFGTCQAQIQRIACGHVWKHVR